ncbi:MAG: hypothetical protein IPI67_08585 [Myxococcales bacterium]|nr:hypothetical protein [Myxococcales bacterium]
MRGFLLSGMACLALSLAAACGGDDGGGGGGGSGGGNTGCIPQAAECYSAGPSGPGAECLAKADNSSSAKWQGRLSSILVKSPPALAAEFVQAQVIDKGISLKQPSCNENGDGTFSWLFEIDPATKKMRTGGALPITDPKAGGCFVSLPGAAVPVAPIDVDVTLGAGDMSFSAKDLDVNVPIFLSPTDLSNPIILPLHKVEIEATFNDATHNCAGKFNGAELEPINSCQPDTKAIPPQRTWTPGGALKGYITVDEADKVNIDTLGASLCVLLAGVSWKGPEKNCQSSDQWKAGSRPEGDWCAATNSAADASCKDAYLLAADFAASGFKINGDCP